MESVKTPSRATSNRESLSILSDTKGKENPSEFLLSEKTLKSSSMVNGITTENTKEIAENIPWYRKMTPEKREYYKHYNKRDHQEAVRDLLLPAVYHVGEIIHSEDKPPQVRLQAAQIIINKCISDKIDIVQQKQVVDINKLIDQAMVLSQLSRQDTTRDITPIDNNDKDIK